MLAAGARVVMVDRDATALAALAERHGDAVIPLVIDLLDAAACATLLPRALEKAGQLDILHANAGIYVGEDLVALNMLGQKRRDIDLDARRMERSEEHTSELQSRT